MLAMIGVLFLILNKTKIGLAFRAVSSTLESSRLVGIRVGPTLQFGWALAAAFGTLGGALVARQTNLEPAFMAKLVIFSFAAATLGGLDSIGGAVIGAFIVAMIQSLLVGYAQQIPGLALDEVELRPGHRLRGDPGGPVVQARGAVRHEENRAGMSMMIKSRHGLGRARRSSPVRQASSAAPHASRPSAGASSPSPPSWCR